MTARVDDSRTDPGPGGDAPRSQPGTPTGHRPPVRWWRRAWVGPLAFLLGLFVLSVLPSWLTFDPATVPERVTLPTDAAYKYPLLLTHIAVGVIAYVTVCLQLWPWLRAHHPAVHRMSGRVYVFAGILPAALLALVLVPIQSQGTVARIGTTLWALIALGTTITGFLLARRGRYAEHRRWMLYSFATATAVVSGRALAALVYFLPGIGHQLSAASGGIEGFWLGWVVNLALAHWWWKRTSARPLDELIGGLQVRNADRGDAAVADRP